MQYEHLSFGDLAVDLPTLFMHRISFNWKMQLKWCVSVLLTFWTYTPLGLNNSNQVYTAPYGSNFTYAILL